ncbi:MAG: branched-chain amino acid ABC transporter permease [Pseudomonadota bacterium]
MKAIALPLAVTAAGTIAHLLVPEQSAFLARVAIMMLFVVSIDLVTGTAKIATLGQAAFFGLGAYAAGLLALHGTAAPLPGLLFAALVGGVAAAGFALFLLRVSDLAFLVLTIAFAALLFELSNQWRGLTGGADGLFGILMSPIAGTFSFDLFGVTAFWYALAVLALALLVLSRVMASPFGLSVRALGLNPLRTEALGYDVRRRQIAIFSLAGAVAGLAGGLNAQVTELVSPSVFAFALSAEAVVMLVLGGAGRLTGAVVGTAVYMGAEHFAAANDPFNWLFVVAGLLLLVVFVMPRGIVGLFSRR